MKKLVLFVLVSILVLGSVVSVSANNVVEANGEEIIEQSPRMVVSYTKVVERSYVNYSDIPEVISYSEFNEEYWTYCSGVLYLQSVQRTGNYWRATFRGSLSGTI